MIRNFEEYLKRLEEQSSKRSNNKFRAFHNNSEEIEFNKEADEFNRREKQQTLQHKEEMHKQTLENEQQNISLRLNFAYMVFWLTVSTLGVIAFLIIYSGFAHLFNNQFLSDRILTALIGFAGIDMLGIFAIILSYLFNKAK